MVITRFFGSKQWRYYYSKSGYGKEGIFVETLGCVNQIEQTVDVILCLLAGSLLLTAVSPTFWFAVLAIYNLFVLLRTILVLCRPKFAVRLIEGGTTVPKQYGQIETHHNKFWVPAILWGWILTHTTSCLMSASIFVILFLGESMLEKPWKYAAHRFAGMFLLIGILFLASDLSYRFGCKICPPSKKTGKFVN